MWAGQGVWGKGGGEGADNLVVFDCCSSGVGYDKKRTSVKSKHTTGFCFDMKAFILKVSKHPSTAVY